MVGRQDSTFPPVATVAPVVPLSGDACHEGRATWVAVSLGVWYAREILSAPVGGEGCHPCGMTLAHLHGKTLDKGGPAVVS